MPPNDARAYILRWKAEIDQILEGLKRRDPMAISHARNTLLLISSNGSEEVLNNVFAAIAAYWENVT